MLLWHNCAWAAALVDWQCRLDDLIIYDRLAMETAAFRVDAWVLRRPLHATERLFVVNQNKARCATPFRRLQQLAALR